MILITLDDILSVVAIIAGIIVSFLICWPRGRDKNG